MKIRIRDVLALVAVLLAIAAAGIAATPYRVAPGIQMTFTDSRTAVVTAVERGSAAEAFGITPGTQILVIDEQPVGEIPAETRTAFVTGARQPLEIEVAGSPPESILPGIAVGVTVTSADVPAPATARTETFAIWFEQIDEIRRQMLPGAVLGLVVLAAGWWWLATGRAGPTLRRLAVTLPVAVAAPLLLLPAGLVMTLPARTAVGVILPLAMVPLAIDLAALIEDRAGRVMALTAALLCAAAAAFLGSGLGPVGVPVLVTVGLVALATFLPGLFAARLNLFGVEAASGGTARNLVESSELLLAGATPGIATLSLASRGELVVWPILLWLGAVLAIRTVTLRPLARLVGRTSHQRDAIVAATEAERARIAADIHDDALQDLTMLVRRLDAAGNAEDAETARQVAARLRTICGELRLPILDDLGIGPALEWLTERMEPLAGGPVYLERSRDEVRLPPAVELAAFRVAQEALTNAVRHGRPPIVVRYRSGPGWLELDVDDSGPGVPVDAAERGEAAGHFGLLGMSQRAEQIGGELAIGRRPGGGTRVTLTWEAAAAETSPSSFPAAELT